VSGQTQPDGTRENQFTHAGKNRQREQGKYCKCRRCGNVEVCTPERDFWGGNGQPLLCDFRPRVVMGRAKASVPIKPTPAPGKGRVQS
jgi:hypothetical protein